MKDRICIPFLLGVILLFSSSIYGGGVVFFNPDEALSQLREEGFFKKENKVFNRRVGMVNKRLKKRQKELNSLKKELIKLKKMGQREDLKKLTEEYKKKMKEFKKYLKKSNEKISGKRREIKKVIEESLLSIVNEYAASNDCNVVLEKRSGSIVFARPKWDITDRIVDIYVQRFNSLKDVRQGDEFKSEKESLSRSDDRLFNLGMKYFKENSFDQASMVWERMINQSDRANYTIILQSSCKEKEIKSIFKDLTSLDQLFILSVPMSSKSCYRVCYGLYKDKVQAQKNLDGLRKNLEISLPDSYIFDL